MKLTTALLVLLPLNVCLAFGPRGHMLVAQIAYDTLPVQKKQLVRQYSNDLYASLSNHTKKQLNKIYPTKNHFTQLAALADGWRDQSLAEIFARFNAPLPTMMKPYANDTTNSWHYIDLPYGNQACKPFKTKNILFALSLLQHVWQQTKNEQAKAVVMILLTHLVGDVYQPLHNFSFYNKQCNYDLGGNRYPIQIGKHHSTLHALWDQGVGYLFHKKNLAMQAKRLQKEFSRRLFKQQLTHQNPIYWINKNLRYAPFVYSLKRNQRVPAWYYRKGQAIIRSQITLAGYQLANILY